MRGIKMVIWERNIAHQQAEYLIQRENYKQELLSQNEKLSYEKLNAAVLAKFPTAIFDVGRKQAKKTGSTRLANIRKRALHKKDVKQQKKGNRGFVL